MRYLASTSDLCLFWMPVLSSHEHTRRKNRWVQQQSSERLELDIILHFLSSSSCRFIQFQSNNHNLIHRKDLFVCMSVFALFPSTFELFKVIIKYHNICYRCDIFHYTTKQFSLKDVYFLLIWFMHNYSQMQSRLNWCFHNAGIYT